MPVDQTKSLAGRIGAATKWSQCADRSAATAPARQAALERFERQVDPDGVLPPDERARRAEHARKAFFLRLAAKSAATRRANAARKASARAEELEQNAATREERIAEAERLAAGGAA